MKRLASFAFVSALSACNTFAPWQAMVAATPVVTAGVEVVPTPPEPLAPPAAGDAGAEAVASVETPPAVTAADPEEVTASIYEEPTETLGPGYVWAGGYWGWTGSDWGWYSGQWLMPPEGRLYIEPYYERVGSNVVFVRGYWGTHDAALRSYGGDRIVFATATRPADYKPGAHPAFQRSPGAAPGTRSATAYVHATGTPRAVPQAKAPSYLAAKPAARGQAVASHDTAHGPKPAPQHIDKPRAQAQAPRTAPVAAKKHK